MLCYIATIRSPNQVVLDRSFDMFSRAVRVIRCHSIQKFVQIIKFKVPADKLSNHLGATLVDFRTNIHHHDSLQKLRVTVSQCQGHHPSHGVPNYDRCRYFQGVQKRLCILCHILHRIMRTPIPLRISMTSLIQGKDVISRTQMKAHQIPGVA